MNNKSYHSQLRCAVLQQCPWLRMMTTQPSRSQKLQPMVLHFAEVANTRSQRFRLNGYTQAVSVDVGWKPSKSPLLCCNTTLIKWQPPVHNRLHVDYLVFFCGIAWCFWSDWLIILWRVRYKIGISGQIGGDFNNGYWHLHILLFTRRLLETGLELELGGGCWTVGAILISSFRFILATDWRGYARVSPSGICKMVDK